MTLNRLNPLEESVLSAALRAPACAKWSVESRRVLSEAQSSAVRASISFWNRTSKTNLRYQMKGSSRRGQKSWFLILYPSRMSSRMQSVGLMPCFLA